jgi:hypothetical protein
MQYMVRTEMHNASREMYDSLHAAMGAESFNRILTNENNLKKSRMPTGTYWIESSADAWTILEAAKRAALSVDRSVEIVVSGGPKLVYYNCADEVPEHPLAAMLAIGLRAPLPAPPSSLSSLFAPSKDAYPQLVNMMSLLSAPPASPATEPSLLSGIARLPYIRS